MEVNDVDIETAIKNVQAGSDTEYAYIIDQYEKKIFTTVFRLVRQYEVAQDLVQEIFIKVFYNLNKYKGNGSFHSWLYRIVVNQCYDYLRKQRKLIEARDIEIIEKQYPEKILLQQEELRQLEQLLQHLTNDEYVILLLRYVNELRYDEISDVMQIPLNEVRNKLHRSKKKLRQLAAAKGGYFYEVR